MDVSFILHDTFKEGHFKLCPFKLISMFSEAEFKEFEPWLKFEMRLKFIKFGLWFLRHVSVVYVDYPGETSLN